MEGIMRNILLFIVGLLLLVGCSSVDKGKTTSDEGFEVPRNYSFKTEADFKKYESDILKCIDYLENAPVNDLSNNRKKINSFLLDWLSDVPYVHITINGSVLDLCKENGNFLIIFMGGWTKYVLLNSEDQNEKNGYFAGIETILDVYRKGNGVKPDEKIVELIKIQDEGKLMDWVMQ
jgi:hypothetical protein